MIMTHYFFLPKVNQLLSFPFCWCSVATTICFLTFFDDKYGIQGTTCKSPEPHGEHGHEAQVSIDAATQSLIWI